MKKFVVALFAATLCISVSAQLRTSRTFVKKAGRATEWIIRGGLSINNMAGMDVDDYNDYHSDESSINLGSKTGFAIDFGFNKYFGQSNSYWGMELGIGTRGLSSTYIYNDGDEKEKGSMTAYTLKFSPFTVGYKIPVTDNLKVDPHIGIYASYDLAREYDNRSEFDYDEYDDDYSGDAGIQLGVGVWYGHFNLDIMYQRGFIDAVDMDRVYDYGKTSNFLIRIGYSF